MTTKDQSLRQAHGYLPRLKAVFFARWDEGRGCEISYQVPESSIGVTSTRPQPESESASPQPQSNSSPRSISEPSGYLFEFSDVLDFVLPKKHLCGHLVTICSGRSKILGFPNLIEDESKYERNFLMFNLCFVFDADSECSGYEPIVRKTGRVLRSSEQKDSLISSPDSPLKIKSLLESLFEELNSFSEVSINLNNQSRRSISDLSKGSGVCDDESYSTRFLLDLKLFPFFGNPPKVEDWDVPLSLVPLVKMRSEVSWDLTMFKLVPFIDGTSTVRKISRQADIDIYLARECIQHLVFFGCCIITDPFRFSNCYSLVGGPALDLMGDSNNPESIEFQEELQAYISIDSDSEKHPPSISKLLCLYSDFKSGSTVHDWMEQNEAHKLPIDVRRFISFGTIKGFLRRLRCYPIWALHPDICDPSFSLSNRKTISASPMLSTLSTHGSNQNNKSPSPSLGSNRRQSKSRRTTSAIREPAWLNVIKKINPNDFSNYTNSFNNNHNPLTNNNGSQDFSTTKAPTNPKPSSSSTLTVKKRQQRTEDLCNPNQHIRSTNQVVPNDLFLKLDGSHDVDELCVEFEMSLIRLEGVLRIIDTVSLEEVGRVGKECFFDDGSCMQTIYY
ncbi:nitrogen permease regulator 2-domain-containing protein [Phakopsora pachyrhizi]|uniref:Nitrogen permease regulator 2-domain-containing protein n=1 Tax=Phakopsora pachyrhizi TaxID=170000 RepID=A0AAV0B7R7_PHAPC|nr:nitrogen permease regulator 2-domain-containing protein [Phakopsora pachyrhizi]